MAPSKKTEKQAATMPGKGTAASCGRVAKKTSKPTANYKKTTATGEYRSNNKPYANSFRKAVQEWMRANFPEEVRKKTWPSNDDKRRERKNTDAKPNLVQYLGWLDSLKNRDEAKAHNTSTKRCWVKFCEQPENKKMAASWKAYALDVRTRDGLEKFRPDFSNIGEEHLTKGTGLFQLISFPSQKEFKEKAAGPADESNPDDDDD